MAASLVQQVVGNNGSGTTLVITIATPGAGNSLIALISAVRPVTGITGGGVTWVQGPIFSQTQIWYGHNSSGSGTTITITCSTSLGNTKGANISEWSGLTNAAPQATNTNSNASGSTVTTNSVTPSTSNSLVIAAMSSTTANGYSSGPTNSFTRMTPNSTNRLVEGAYQVESSIAAYSTGISLTSNQSWEAAIAAFGASGASAPTVPQTERNPVRGSMRGLRY